MRMPHLSARDTRALRLGALVLVPALVFSFIVRPLSTSLGDLKERGARERALLRRELALVAGAQKLRAHYATLPATARTSRARAFVASDEVLAQSDLTVYVSTLGEQHGIQFDDLEPQVARSPEPGVVELRMSVGGRGELADLLAFVAALRSGEKVVRIERLEMHRDAGSGTPATDAAIGLKLVVTAVASIDNTATSASVSATGAE